MLSRCTSWPFLLLHSSCLFAFLQEILMFWQLEVVKYSLLVSVNVQSYMLHQIFRDMTICLTSVAVVDLVRSCCCLQTDNIKSSTSTERKPRIINLQGIYDLFSCSCQEKRCCRADRKNGSIKCNLSSRGLWLNTQTFITNSNRGTRIIYSNINMGLHSTSGKFA